MKIKKYFAKAVAAGFALLLVCFAGAPVCYAYPFPPQTLISTASELETWYHNGTGDGVLINSITITGDIKLNVPIGIQEERVLAFNDCHLRITGGASLTIDNSLLRMIGFAKVIIMVEDGGRLVLGHFAGVHVTEGKDAIVIEQGGKLETPYGMPGGVQINDKNPPPDNTLPPEPPDTRIPITSLFDDKAHISCVVGEQPDKSLYLETVYAYFGESDGAELPVKWGLSAVNFTKPGTYTVIGTLTDVGMQEHNLSNPKGYTAKMTITVYQKGAPDSARGEVLSVGSAGNTTARLILPSLPIEKVSAIYLHYSTDGVAWKKAAYATNPDGTVKEESYLSATTTVGASSYIVYKYTTNYRPLWVRVEVVGSDREGMSNAVQLILPEGSKPGDNTQNDSDEDAGDSGGNRGGVGQEETDRVLPPEDGGKKQAAVPVAAGQSGTGGSTSGTAVTGETDDKPADSPFAATPVPGDQPVMAEPQPPATPADTPAKPAIPGAAAAAVCTTGAVAAVSVLLKFNWKAIVKFIQRKP